jgi:hypothetical protein
MFSLGMTIVIGLGLVKMWGEKSCGCVGEDTVNLQVRWNFLVVERHW